MPTPVTYPLDLSGNNQSNLIQNELHSVNESVNRSYYFIVPNFTPFYIDNFQISISINGVLTPLVEDVDFSFAMPYVTGTRTTGKAMYGGITLHNLNLNGILSVTYQTIGGEQIADRLKVLTNLADKAYNPRATVFDILDGLPVAFPPVPHYQDYDQFFGQEELVIKLGQIRDAILQNASLTQTELQSFLGQIQGGSLAGYVSKAGDNMTGPLVLSGPPVAPEQAATKSYVDSVVTSPSQLASTLSMYATMQYVIDALSLKLNKAGDTLGGPLFLNGIPTQPMQAAPKEYVDSTANTLQIQLTSLQSTVNTLGINPATTTYIDDKISEVMTYINHLRRW